MARELTQLEAMKIIRTVGSAGQPPAWGVEYFTDGFEPTLDLLKEEYFSNYLKQGGSAFKLVIGHYGGGKTHFLYLLRDLAWENGFVVTYVSLTPDACPFHRLDLVYRAVCSGISCYVEGEEITTGLSPLLKTTISKWRAKAKDGGPEMVERLAIDSTRDLANLNYQRAMRKALMALVRGGNEDEDLAMTMIQWLSAQGYDRLLYKEHGILGGIDRSTAFSSMRSLAQWVKNAGYSGLVILFDEAERAASMSGKQKEFILSNLRELIDETARGTLPGTMVAYAIPDYRLFDGKTGVYEAVKQRTGSMFDFYNPSGVRIDLEQMITDPEKHLRSIGAKLWRIYEMAHGVEIPPEKTSEGIGAVAAAVLQARFADISYRRLFVQSVVKAFEQIRRKSDLEVGDDWARGIVDGYITGGPA